MVTCMLLVAQLGISQYDVEILGSTTVYITANTTVSFKGNNFISSSNVQGVGPVIFNGSAAQNINMKNLSISGITMDNTNNVTMLDSMTVANTTLFTQGNLKLGSFRITQGGKVEGQGSTGRFTANGNSIMVFNSFGGNDSFFLDQTTPNSTNRLKDLTINRSGATLVCGDTAQIRGVVYHLAGTISGNKSRLKLKALSPTQYGQVSGAGLGTISDTMYMEMQVGGNVQSPLDQWRHFTSPLGGATLSNELNDDITLKYTPVAEANVWNFDQTRSINSWRPIQADEVMHNNTYAIYLWPSSYTGYLPGTSSFVIDINGTYPGTGNFSRTLGRNNPNGYAGQGFDDTVGWHMIPNPYPSGISCKEQANLEGGSAYYIWDISGIWDDSSNCNGCKKRGVYSMYRADNGLAANGGRSVIPPFHVFYVRAAVNNTAFSVNNSWRTTDSMYNNIGRKTSDFDMLHITAKSPENVKDEAYLWFDQYRAENKFDQQDAYKLMNDPYAPNIYTLTEDGKRCVFNVFKEISDDFYSVEMPFESKLSGKFEITFGFENPNQVQTIELEDRKTGKRTDILINKTYSFDHEAGNNKDRFVLHFRKAGATTNIEDYISDNRPIEVTTDASSIFVRFPIVKEGGAIIDVYDMLGRKVMATRNVKTDNEVYIISGAGLSAGYYTVKVQAGKEVKTAPVFISNN
jgi:hypothetical protein